MIVSRLYWIARSCGHYILFRRTQTQRFIPSRVPLEILLTSVSSLIMRINQFFEFLEAFELGYIDWGNNCQWVSKLSKHLSDDLKDKLMTRSDNYALMREWLVQNYGGAARILNDTVMALTRRKKPMAND